MANKFAIQFTPVLGAPFVGGAYHTDKAEAQAQAHYYANVIYKTGLVVAGPDGSGAVSVKSIKVVPV